jgi:uncharacterized iron-regulated membrane protein
MAGLLGLFGAAGLGFALGGLVRWSGRRVIDLKLPQEPSKSRAKATSENDTAAAKEQVMQ